MSRKGSLGAALAAISVLSLGVVVAQDAKKDKPLLGDTGLKERCEKAVSSKKLLAGSKIAIREDGSGRIICEGTVPTKVEACAVYLACMSVHGVGQVDLSKLRIEHWGRETTEPKKGERRASLFAVLLAPDGSREVIAVGDVPLEMMPDPNKGLKEYPSGNPANQVPDKNTQTPATEQPVAPHNPGAYPDNPK